MKNITAIYHSITLITLASLVSIAIPAHAEINIPAEDGMDVTRDIGPEKFEIENEDLKEFEGSWKMPDSDAVVHILTLKNSKETVYLTNADGSYISDATVNRVVGEIPMLILEISKKGKLHSILSVVLEDDKLVGSHKNVQTEKILDVTLKLQKPVKVSLNN